MPSLTDTESQPAAASEPVVLKLGASPAQAIGVLYATIAQALANAARNATSLQQQTALMLVAATGQGAATVFQAGHPMSQP